jgi:hypothetical protein
MFVVIGRAAPGGAVAALGGMRHGVGRWGDGRAPVRRGRGRSGGARHRNPAGRPDRGPGAPGHLRPAPNRWPPAATGLAQVQHRAHPGRRRRRRCDQDGDGDAERAGAADSAHGRTLACGGLVFRRGRVGHPDTTMAADRPAAPYGGVLVRGGGHQRSRHLGGGAARGAGDTAGPRDVAYHPSCRALGDLGTN